MDQRGAHCGRGRAGPARRAAPERGRTPPTGPLSEGPASSFALFPRLFSLSLCRFSPSVSPFGRLSSLGGGSPPPRGPSPWRPGGQDSERAGRIGNPWVYGRRCALCVGRAVLSLFRGLPTVGRCRGLGRGLSDRGAGRGHAWGHRAGMSATRRPRLREYRVPGRSLCGSGQWPSHPFFISCLYRPELLPQVGDVGRLLAGSAGVSTTTGAPAARTTATIGPGRSCPSEVVVPVGAGAERVA